MLVVRSLLVGSAFLFSMSACGGDPGMPIAERTSANDPTLPSGQAHSGVALNVEVEGAGGVRSEPAGIDCPGKCTATFDPGATITLVPTPAEGWKLGQWSGCAAEGADGRCAVKLASTGVPTNVKGMLALIDPRWDPSVGGTDCVEAWGTRGDKLSACDTTKDNYAVVRKSKRNVALCKQGGLVKNFRAGLGADPSGPKLMQGDGKTPEGVFYIPRLLPESIYYNAFLLSYPTPEDARRGLGEGIISSRQQVQIKAAHDACVEPPQSTKLGGDLAIHGHGGTEDWTRGSIAIDDRDVDVLWSALGVHDTIVVLP